MERRKRRSGSRRRRSCSRAKSTFRESREDVIRSFIDRIVKCLRGKSRTKLDELKDLYYDRWNHSFSAECERIFGSKEPFSRWTHYTKDKVLISEERSGKWTFELCRSEQKTSKKSHRSATTVGQTKSMASCRSPSADRHSTSKFGPFTVILGVLGAGEQKDMASLLKPRMARGEWHFFFYQENERDVVERVKAHTVGLLKCHVFPEQNQVDIYILVAPVQLRRASLVYSMDSFSTVVEAELQHPDVRPDGIAIYKSTVHVPTGCYFSFYPEVLIGEERKVHGGMLKPFVIGAGVGETMRVTINDNRFLIGNSGEGEVECAWAHTLNDIKKMTTGQTTAIFIPTTSTRYIVTFVSVREKGIRAFKMAAI